jgi:hypothetical protein
MFKRIRNKIRSSARGKTFLAYLQYYYTSQKEPSIEFINAIALKLMEVDPPWQYLMSIDQQVRIDPSWGSYYRNNNVQKRGAILCFRERWHFSILHTGRVIYDSYNNQDLDLSGAAEFTNILKKVLLQKASKKYV